MKNHGVRQLGFSDIPNMMGKSFKIPWFQTTNQYIYIIPYIIPMVTLNNGWGTQFLSIPRERFPGPRPGLPQLGKLFFPPAACLNGIQAMGRSP